VGRDADHPLAAEMSNGFGWMLWAALAGAGIPVMAALNGALGRTPGSPIAAVVALFAIALLVSASLAAGTGQLGALSNVRLARPEMLAGGLIVAAYILSVTTLVPRYGAGNVILFVMTAQIFSSAAMDRFALFGGIRRPVDSLRGCLENRL